jgi:pSer/pThr/pTyr-binding forkhead associated (FHA) protein
VFCGQCGTRLDVPQPRPAPAPLPRESAPRGKLVLIRPDGSEGGVFPLGEGENLVGRGESPLFESDTYLSPRHALFILQNGQLTVRDADSLNGVFVKMSGEEEIADGEIFRMGQELLRFDVIRAAATLDDGTEVMGSPNPGYWGRLSLIIGQDQDGSAFPLYGESMVIGRERGDILFPEDGYVSGTHARISHREGRYYLADLNSSNGSFIRVRGERTLPNSSFLLMGQQLFRISYN